LSEIPPSKGWAHGQVTWAKMAKNLLHLWHQSANGRSSWPLRLQFSQWRSKFPS